MRRSARCRSSPASRCSPTGGLRWCWIPRAFCEGARMIDVRELGALQLDGLREVANIGAGHAATALSQLTNRRITVDVPEIRVVPLESVPELIGKPDEAIAAVVMQVLGDLTGRTVQVFPGATASRLAGILLDRHHVPFPEGFGEIEQSAIREAGNIL